MLTACTAGCRAVMELYLGRSWTSGWGCSSVGRGGGWGGLPAAGGELRLLPPPIRLLLLQPHPQGCSSVGNDEDWGTMSRRRPGAAGWDGWKLTAGVWGVVKVWSGPPGALVKTNDKLMDIMAHFSCIFHGITSVLQHFQQLARCKDAPATGADPA